MVRNITIAEWRCRDAQFLIMNATSATVKCNTNTATDVEKLYEIVALDLSTYKHNFEILLLNSCIPVAHVNINTASKTNS